MRLARFVTVAVLAAGCVATGPGATPTQLAPTVAPTPSPVPVTVAPTASPAASPVPTPTTIVEGPCPTASPLSVLEVAAADPYCFEGRDIVIRGFLGKAPAIGWLPDTPQIVKPWRWPPGALVLWQRGPGGEAMCGDTEACDWLALNVMNGSTLDFSMAPGWVVVTVHRSDPAAETCVWDPDFEGELPPVEDARAECRLNFVVTAVRKDLP